MLPIHYKTHFAVLSGAVLILYTPIRTFIDHLSFGAFWVYFGFLGFLHAVSIVAALNVRKAFGKRLVFLFLTFVLAMLAPAIYMAVGYLSRLTPDGEALGWLKLILAYGGSSASAAFLYGYLIKHFWWNSLSFTTLGLVSCVCGVVSFFAFMLIGSNLLPRWLTIHLITILWWFTFSIALLYSGAEDKAANNSLNRTRKNSAPVS